jgi:hypothetical protein
MAYPWSKYPTQVITRLDWGISRVQEPTEYWNMSRKDLMVLESLAIRTRNFIAGVYQDADAR